MFKGDIGLLAKMCECSVSTIYNVGGQLNIDLHPAKNRCKETVDFISGETAAYEQQDWLEMVAEKIKEHRAKKKVRTKKEKIKVPEQLVIG